MSRFWKPIQHTWSKLPKSAPVTQNTEAGVCEMQESSNPSSTQLRQPLTKQALYESDTVYTAHPSTYDDAIQEIARLRSMLREFHTGSSHPLHINATMDEPSLNGEDFTMEDGGVDCLCFRVGDTKKHREASFDEYMATPIYRIHLKRLPWLVALLIIQSFSATILGAFEDLLDRKIVLAMFIPMLVGTGGNSGNQPGVMVTRALATGRIDVKRLAWKEFKTGFITSLVLSGIAFLRVLMEYPDDPVSAAAIATALFVSILISIMLGVLFSVGLDKLKTDPADGAAPLLTTISDLLGISLLCAIAVAYMPDI